MSSDRQSRSKTSVDFEVRNRDLLIIDDRLVREKYFSQAHEVLTKIDEMETKIQAFHSTDQRLFDQWFRLTFKEDQAVVDRSREDLKQVARFHNWVVATALKLNIEMPQAYVLMKEEERLWDLASAEEKKKIDLEREARDRYVSAEVHGRDNESYRFDSDDEAGSEMNAQIGTVLSHLEILIFQQDFEHLPQIADRIEQISELPDSEIKYWLKEQDAAFLLFDLSLSWSESQNDFSFFRRIWSLMSNKQKKDFSEVYSLLSGRSMQELLDDIGASEESRTSSKGEDGNEDLDDDETAFQFDENSESRGNSKTDPSGRRSKSGSKGQHKKIFENEKLKSLYRKLVRKLHPDLQASRSADHSEGWTAKAWEMVQKAYHGADVAGLQKILKLTLLRSKALDQLTLDEITDARKWLKKDLDVLESESQHLKLSPAWGFSQKKDYAPLSRKIEKDFRQMLNQVRFQIAEVRRELDMLEVLSTADFDFDRAPRRPRSRNSSRSRSKNSSQSKSRRLREDLQDFQKDEVKF